MEISQQVSWTENWLLPGGKLLYQLQAHLDEYQISTVVHTLLFPLQLFSQDQLLDVRGRGSSQELLAGPQIAPSTYELLRIDGDLLQISENEPPESFSVTVHTPFKEFSSGAHIIHSQQSFCENTDLRSVPLNLLGFVMPIDISLFRLGLAFYSPTRAGIFGVSPEVREELLIDCSKQEFRLELRSQALAKKNELPQLQAQFFPWLQLALDGLFGIDLEHQLTSIK